VIWDKLSKSATNWFKIEPIWQLIPQTILIPKAFSDLCHKKIMGKEKAAERLIAQELYVNTDLTVKEIAARLQVREATISGWKNADGWDTIKTAKKITRAELIRNFYQAISTMQTQISERPSPFNVPTSKEADIISKLTSQIEKLEKSNSISDYISAFEEFIDYLRTKRPDLVKDFAQLSLGFIELKAKEMEGKK
jgi:transcriptional regulator with XRE-family HTH domain